jgi:UBX domain-containing protein 1/4
LRISSHYIHFHFIIKGKDDNSKCITNILNTESISSKLKSEMFVAVKIESDKEEYLQFCKIFQLVPVPSIFFIKNSVPIKIVTSAVKTIAEMEEAINNIIKQETGSAAGSTNSFLEMEKRAETSNKADDSTEIVCEGNVCYKKTTSENIENQSENASVEDAQNEKVETEEEKQEKIKRAMKLIEEKRIERIKEEQRLENEREIKRRKEGKELQDLKKWQDDQELQSLRDERRREKEEAKAARQRVLEQIEQDKKDRAKKFNQASVQPQESSPVKPPEPPTTPTIDPNSTKIQFKRPDGSSDIVTFDTSMIFADLHAFVASDILSGLNIKEFQLATTFPRYEFTEQDFPKTLLELKLVPSSVILIISSRKSSSKPATSVLPTASDGSFFDMIGALIFGLFSPVFALFTYMKNYFTGAGNGSDGNDAGKRKRDENILTPNDA